jgi:hypothetical protein
MLNPAHAHFNDTNARANAKLDMMLLEENWGIEWLGAFVFLFPTYSSNTLAHNIFNCLLPLLHICLQFPSYLHLLLLNTIHILAITSLILA